MALKKNDLINLWDIQSKGLTDSIKSQLLIPTGRGNVYASRDYIKANAIIAHVNKQNELLDLSSIPDLEALLNLIDPATRFRLKSFTPCLAYRYDELKPPDQKSFFTDPNWRFTEKMNGVRGWYIYYKGKEYLFSRNYSDVDCAVPEYWGNIFQSLNLGPGEILAIDVEVMFDPGALLQEELIRYGLTTDSKLEAMSALLQMNQKDALEIQRKFKEDKGKDLVAFRMIHPLYYNKTNYIKAPLGDGMDVCDYVLLRAQLAGLNIKYIPYCEGNKEEKENFLNSIIEKGGEGIVGHYRKGSYNTSENRSKTSYMKLKRSVGAQAANEGLGDAIDGWISGFKMGKEGTSNEGLISAFEISINIMAGGKTYEHVIACVPNIARTMQIAATVTDPSDGTVTMNEDFYDMVVEVDGQAISRVAHRLTHPRMIRVRADKSKHQCVYTKEFIESQIDTLHD